jgi:hypothetical protein
MVLNCDSRALLNHRLWGPSFMEEVGIEFLLGVSISGCMLPGQRGASKGVRWARPRPANGSSTTSP